MKAKGDRPITLYTQKTKVFIMSEINFEVQAKDLGINPKVLEEEYNTQLKVLNDSKQKPIKQGTKTVTVEDMALNAAKVGIFNGELNRELPAVDYIAGQSPTKQAKSEKKTKYKTTYLIVDLEKSAGMLRKKNMVNDDQIHITATQWSSQSYPPGFYTCKLRERDGFYVINNIETLQESKKHSEDFGLTLEEFDIFDIDPSRIFRIVKRYPIKEFDSSFREGEKFEMVSLDVLTKKPNGEIEQIMMSTNSTKVWGNPRLDETVTYRVVVTQKGKYFNFDGSLEVVEPDSELEEKFKSVSPITFSTSEEGNDNLYTFKILDRSDIKTGPKKDGSTYSMMFLTLLGKRENEQPEIISCSTFRDSWFNLNDKKDQLYEGLIFKNGQYNTLSSDPKKVDGDISIENLDIKKYHSFSKLDPESKEILMLVGYPEKPPVFSEKEDGTKQAFCTISDIDGYEVTIAAFDGSVMEDSIDSEGRLPGIVGVVGTLREYKNKINIVPLKIVEADDSIEIEDVEEDEDVWG